MQKFLFPNDILGTYRALIELYSLIFSCGKNLYALPRKLVYTQKKTSYINGIPFPKGQN